MKNDDIQGKITQQLNQLPVSNSAGNSGIEAFPSAPGGPNISTDISVPLISPSFTPAFQSTSVPGSYTAMDAPGFSASAFLRQYGLTRLPSDYDASGRRIIYKKKKQ